MTGTRKNSQKLNRGGGTALQKGGFRGKEGQNSNTPGKTEMKWEKKKGRKNTKVAVKELSTAQSVT